MLRSLKTGLKAVWNDIRDEVRLLSTSHPYHAEPLKHADTAASAHGMYVFMRVLPTAPDNMVPMINQFREPILNVEFNFIGNSGRIIRSKGSMTCDDIGYLVAHAGKPDGPANVYLPEPGIEGFSHADFNAIKAAAESVSGSASLSSLVRIAKPADEGSKLDLS